MKYYIYEAEPTNEPDDDYRYFEVDSEERVGSTALATVESDEEYQAAESFIKQLHDSDANFRLALEPIGDARWMAEFQLIED